MKRIVLVFLAVIMVISLYSGEVVAASSVVDKYLQEDLKIIVPYAVGGNMDIYVRVIAKFLSEKTGQPVVVENRPGAAGMVAATEYLAQKPDTHVLMSLSAGAFSSAPLYNEVAYTLDDFVPVIGMAFNPFGLYVNPAKSDVHTLKELVEYGKEKQGIIFGGGTPGSDAYLIQIAVYKTAGLKAEGIPSGGSNVGLTQLLGGHVDVTLSPMALAKGFVEDGSLTPICTFSPEPYTEYEGMEVPTVKSLGYDIEYEAFTFLAIRKGTNPEIVKGLNGILQEVFADPEFIASMDKLTIKMSGMESEAVMSLLKARAENIKQLYETYDKE